MQWQETITGKMEAVRGEQGTMQKFSAHFYRMAGLVVLPLVIAGLFALSMTAHVLFRYDQSLFTGEYQAMYHSPGVVARELETALREGDDANYTELTGMRNPPSLNANPNIVLSVLFEVDTRDYFHYLYFDTDTFERHVHYIKEVNGRWIASPQDAYYYYDSGEWLSTLYPILSGWWLALLIYEVGRYFFRAAANTRQTMGR